MNSVDRPGNVVLLAAGLGARLRPLTVTVPKALVLCIGWPMLAYALEIAKRVVRPGGRITVVGGYKAELVREYLESDHPDVALVVNPEFEKANILSVAAGVRAVEGGFLLMNVDHIYPFAFADRLTGTPGDVVAAVDHDRTLVADDMKVKLGPGRTVAGISKRLTEFDVGYIGMTLVRDSGAAAWREAFEAVLAERPDTGVAEDVLQRLADTGRPAATCDLSGLCWLEVDNLEDLENAEERLQDEPGFLHRTWEG